MREILRRKVIPIVGRYVHPHMMRHSYATRLREHGAELLLIGEQLGHADPKTTAIYAHLTSATTRQLVDRFWTGESLGGPHVEPPNL